MSTDTKFYCELCNSFIRSKKFAELSLKGDPRRNCEMWPPATEGKRKFFDHAL